MSVENKAGVWIRMAIPLLMALAFLIATIVDRSFLYASYFGFSYYALLATFLAWFYYLAQLEKQDPGIWKHCVKVYGRGAIVALVLTVVVFVSVKPYFRVLDDEANYLSVSRALLFNKQIYNVTQAKWFHFNLQYADSIQEKRPYLFPFLMHWLHLFFGYRPVHAFVVNFILLFGALTLAFSACKRYLGAVAAYAALWMILAQPVVTQTAASAGIDMTLIFFVLLTLVSLEYYLRQPSPFRLTLFWLHALLLMNARYEASLYTVAIVGILLMRKKIPWHYFTSSPVYAFSGFLVLPTIWQRFLVKTYFQTAPGEAPFSIAHLLKHHGHFLKSLFHFDLFLPYATIINGLGTLGLGYLAWRLFFQKRTQGEPQQTLGLCVLAVFIMQWVLMNAYYHDLLMTADGTRLFALSAWFFSLLALLFLCRLPVLNRYPGALCIVAVCFFAYYHPISEENRFSNGLLQGREARIVLDFLKRQETRNFLLITQRPGLYAAHNYGTVSIEYANAHKEELLKELQEHLYDQMLVVQQIRQTSGQPEVEALLDPAFRMEPVYELKRDEAVFIRISRVKPGTE